MKTSLKLLLAALVLLTQAFAQEPKQALDKISSSGETKTQTVVAGAKQHEAPVVEPKALPVLNPPLGDIARQARAAHAAAQKAHVVVDTDTAAPKTDDTETTAAAPKEQ